MLSETTHRWLVRIYFVAWLLAWAYRAHAHVWLHQLQSPVLQNAWVDPLYWLLQFLKVPHWATGSYTNALAIDIGLLVLPIVCIILPGNRFFIGAFWLLFSVYYFCFNTFGLSHTHCLVGFLTVPVAFFPKNPRGRLLIWEGMRYFLCWAFFAAFCWKLARGYFWAPEHGLAILQSTRAMFLAYQPDTLLAQGIRWFLQNPTVIYLLMCAGALVQSCFVVGFFTKRLDRLLFSLHICFHLFTYLLMDIVFFELLVLNLAFLPFCLKDK